MKMKLNLKRIWREHVRPFLILLIVLCSVRSAIADWNTVPTGSMKPTIVEGDRIWVNKLAYGLKVPFTTCHLMRWDQPQRGEIVVFYSPADGVRLVKRVAAVPGDVVQMTNDQLIINGQAASYGPLSPTVPSAMTPAERKRHEFALETIGAQKHPVMATPGVVAMRSFGPVTVPPGYYFMLGDNRDESADSRYIGMVPADAIVGRSSRVVLSLDYDDYYMPRGDRWLKALP
jgi:signal peptidase I